MVQMKNLFFIKGRLTWPPVILVVFLAATDVTLDVIWRAVSVPFTSLMILGGTFVVAGLCLILILARLLNAKMRDRPEAH